jgi:DNA polymerase-4
VTGERAILHVDMDAFFASVEQLEDPALRGRPVLVGHDGPRGVVAAASYEARAFGCHSAQPMVQARRCCPQAVIMPGRGARYREISQRVFAIFEDVTPLVEPLSIDEAFLDITGSVHLLGPPPAIARLIKQRVRDEISLTASVGVAFNKFLAKLASDWDKPDGLTVIAPEDVPTRVAALPIKKMWGVGPAMAARLAGISIATFGDLQRLSLDDARRLLGRSGEHFWKLANGLDDRPVTPDHQARSIGNEQTFGADITFPEQVRQVLLAETEHVALRLRRHDLRGRTVTVKIRYGDFETITRSTTLPSSTDSTNDLWRAAAGLFDRWAEAGFQPVRLIGVSVSHLQPRRGRQMELFIDEREQRQRELDRATDEIQSRFGRGSIHRGIPYTDEPS